MASKGTEVLFAPGGDPATTIIRAITRAKIVIRAALFVITDPDIRPIRPVRLRLTVVAALLVWRDGPVR